MTVRRANWIRRPDRARTQATPACPASYPRLSTLGLTPPEAEPYFGPSDHTGPHRSAPDRIGRRGASAPHSGPSPSHADEVAQPGDGQPRMKIPQTAPNRRNGPYGT